LFSFPILHVASRPGVWKQWLAELPPWHGRMKVGPTFELTSHLIQAVSSGMGIALVPKFLVADELASGAVVIAHPHSFQSGMNYYLFTPLNRSALRSIQVFRDWLLKIQI
jgi:LysR family transcriptional regulator, glycine cleavage system transcriptional activator